MSAPVARRPRRTSARDAIRCVLLALALLAVCEGDAVGHAADHMQPGLRRDVLAAVGGPTGWVADRLPFAAATDQVSGWFSPDDGTDPVSSGDSPVAVAGPGTSRVPPAAFDPAALGLARPARALHALLVTGDSMSQPLDAQLARDLAPGGVRTVRDPHLGSGISKPFLVDWVALAAQQARRQHPDAVLVFLGANEGFPLRSGKRDVPCCSPEWAAAYATRARAMMQSYSRGGATQVYWVLLPLPRDPARARVARTVNAAVRVAAGAFGAQVEVVDDTGLFTPGGHFRSAMPIGGRVRVVREPDGIHLNEEGAKLLAGLVRARLRARFSAPPG